MEVCFIVNTFKKEGRAPSTEKVFLGRLCEEAVVVFLEKSRGLTCLARNIRFRFGEIDLLVECPKTGQKWAVEVRGRKGNRQLPVNWISQRKIQRLKRLVQVLCRQLKSPCRLLFVQVEIIWIGVPESYPRGREWKMKITDWELSADS